MHDMENNNQDSLIHVENACTENIKNEDELTQTDVNIVEEYNAIFKKKGDLIESNLNKFQMRDDGSFYVYQEDNSIRDEVQGHKNSDSDSSNHEHCHFDDALEMKCHSLEKSSPVPTSHGFKNPYSSNEKISDCTQCATVEDQNEPFSLNDKKIAEDKNINATDNTGKELSAEMLRKLLEIKIKWKHFCENSIALDENEIDKLFQSMGLSLETPTVKTEPLSKTVKKIEQQEEEVKSIQEIFSMGLENKNHVGDSQPQTYSQVFTKYKNNKTMITGSQIPLHRVMSTLFDPKKLQVQHMDKWLNVDNNSKRFVWGMEGVMSIVSAFSMKNELFALKNGRGKKPDCGPYDGLVDIIWQAGDGNSAIVVQYEPQFSYTRLFECLDAKICFNMNEVRSQLASVYATPQPPISLILSVILTRGLDRIQKDLASSKIKTLLTPDGDETWSLILLLLIGQAVGHIMHTQFPKNWDPVRSPIGILSLDEYGEKVYVSPFFKTPRFPLWLLHYCHDSNHYSLLFGHCRQLLSDWKEEKNFTLHHWDFDDQEMKVVQIRTTGRITQDPDEVKDVLEMIVRTKWPIANIDIKPSVAQHGGLSVEQFPSLRQRLFSKPLELVKSRSYF